MIRGNGVGFVIEIIVFVDEIEVGFVVNKECGIIVFGWWVYCIYIDNVGNICYKVEYLMIFINVEVNV